MKKNTMMRLASFLLVAVLISTSAISGTYAKYVTEGSASDTARVAKFGVEVLGTSEIFSDSYKDKATDYTVNEKGAAITVQADTEGTNVVAPGTNGALVEFELTGTPEVDVKVTYESTVDLAGWNLDGKVYYCPLTITVEDTSIYGLDYTSEADFETAIKKAIDAHTKEYDTNTNLANVDDKDALSVSWAWAYEGADGEQTDEYDTMLGDQAADGKAATISIAVTCTVTQVD